MTTKIEGTDFVSLLHYAVVLLAKKHSFYTKHYSLTKQN